MNYFLILCFFFIVGCAAIEKKKETPPSVSTGQIIASLNDTKTELNLAGQDNEKISISIDKALSLAQRLDNLLNQIEKEQSNLNNKNIIKPIK
jgi:hypothetical protein